MIKYLYILTSDEKDYYLEEALLSIFSLRKIMPNAFVSLLVDDLTEKTIIRNRNKILDNIDELKVIEIDSNFNKKMRSRWLKTSMRQHIEGNFLYVDSDTIICEDLSETELFEFDLGVVLAGHRLINENYLKFKYIKNDKLLGYNSTEISDKYYNSGVIYCKDTLNNHAFFSEWHKLWLEGKSKILFDQPSFNQTNIKFNHIITEIDGSWNCQIYNYGMPYIFDSKIIHLYNSSVKNESLFYPSILKHIKKISYIDDSLNIELSYFKKHLLENVLIIHNKNKIEFIKSKEFNLIIKNYKSRVFKYLLKAISLFFLK